MSHNNPPLYGSLILGGIYVLFISHLVYLYYRASRGYFPSLRGTRENMDHNSPLLAMNDATIMLLYK